MNNTIIQDGSKICSQEYITLNWPNLNFVRMYCT